MTTTGRSAVLLVRAWQQGEGVVARLTWTTGPDGRGGAVAAGRPDVHRLLDAWLDEFEGEVPDRS